MISSFETIYKGRQYTADIIESGYGGYDLIVRKMRPNGKTPLSIFYRHYHNEVEAKKGMEDCLNEATWRKIK